MKKMILAVVAVAAGVVVARAEHGQPAYVSASYGYASPSYSVSYRVSTPPPCPPPQVVCAPPVYYAPPRVVYQPAYCAPRPVYYAPAPAYHVSYGYSGRGYGRSYGNGRWCR